MWCSSQPLLLLQRRLGLALLLVLVGLAAPVLAHERVVEPSWKVDRGLTALLDDIAERLLEEPLQSELTQTLERAQGPRFRLFDPAIPGGSGCSRFEKPHVGGTYPLGLPAPTESEHLFRLNSNSASDRN